MLSRLLSAATWTLVPSFAFCADIMFGDIRAKVIEQGDRYQVQLPTGDTQTAEPGSHFKIFIDGLYAQSPDGRLSLLHEVPVRTDPGWRTRKDQIENMTVEPATITDGLAIEYDLAFRAALDANARTSLELLLEEGVEVSDAHDLTWVFSADNPDHTRRATIALERLAEAVSNKSVRLAGTASKLVLGFVPAEQDGSSNLYWPLDASEELSLAPRSMSDTPHADKTIGNHILTEQPSWFAIPGEIADEIVVCLPFGGCGYVASEAVAPVRPLWIVFDRTTLKPQRLVLD